MSGRFVDKREAHGQLRKRLNQLIGNEDVTTITQIQAWFDEKLLSDERFKGYWDSSSLVVGMHPDEATDDIVRLALKHNKSFAVVPCCVFPKLRPRFFKSGKRVHSYREYCDWLVELNPAEIQRTTLNFEGRNEVVYRKSTAAGNIFCQSCP